MIADQDSRFIGLDMRRDPAVVGEGYYTIGEHVECEDGTVRTRRGNLVIPWADTYQYTDQYTKRAVEKHGTIIDAIRFADTDEGRDYVLLCTSSTAVLCLPGSTAQEIAYPLNYTPADDARLVQAFNKVYLLGGDDKRPLVWDGDSTTDFIFADTGSLAAGYEYMPNTRIGCYHKNRLWVAKKNADNINSVGGRSTVLPSDVLEGDFKTVNEFYVNHGDSDEIKALVPYTDNRIIAFKNNSMYSLDGLTGDLSNSEINLISNNIGIVADRSAQVMGPNVIWLSRKGVMMAQLVQEQRLTPDTIPLSEPIEPIIRRINWPYAEQAVSTIHNDRYYLAITIDDATKNNCVVVYNFKNQAWESVDIYEPTSFTSAEDTAYDESFGPQSMVIVKYSGKETLITTTYAGCLALYRYNEGKGDIAIEGTTDISTWLASFSTSGATAATTQFIRQTLPFTSVVQTRGYLAGDLSTKKGCHLDLTIDTFNPSFSIDLVTSGPGESESILSGKTRDRTKRLDWVNSATTTAIDNASNEHSNPYLDDYSIHIYSALNSQTTSAYPQFYFGAGAVDDVYLNRMQEFQERFRVYKRARAPRVKVSNTQGVVALKSVSILEYDRKRKHRREV